MTFWLAYGYFGSAIIFSIVDKIYEARREKRKAKLAKKYGVDLTYDEASKIVPFLKRNKNNLNKENKNRLLNEGRNLVKPQTYSKIVTLIDRFI